MLDSHAVTQGVVAVLMAVLKDSLADSLGAGLSLTRLGLDPERIDVLHPRGLGTGDGMICGML